MIVNIQDKNVHVLVFVAKIFHKLLMWHGLVVQGQNCDFNTCTSIKILTFIVLRGFKRGGVIQNPKHFLPTLPKRVCIICFYVCSRFQISFRIRQSWRSSECSILAFNRSVNISQYHLIENLTLEIISWNFIFISKYEFWVVKKKIWQQNFTWRQTSDNIFFNDCG